MPGGREGSRDLRPAQEGLLPVGWSARHEDVTYDKNRCRNFKKARLAEVSIVGMPANKRARVAAGEAERAFDALAAQRTGRQERGEASDGRSNGAAAEAGRSAWALTARRCTVQPSAASSSSTATARRAIRD